MTSLYLTPFKIFLSFVIFFKFRVQEDWPKHQLTIPLKYQIPNLWLKLKELFDTFNVPKIIKFKAFVYIKNWLRTLNYLHHSLSSLKQTVFLEEPSTHRSRPIKDRRKVAEAPIHWNTYLSQYSRRMQESYWVILKYL